MAVTRWFLKRWEENPFTHERVARVVDDAGYERLIPRSQMTGENVITGAEPRKVSCDDGDHRYS